MRAIAYIDGFNLYYGMREKGLRRFYWLDMAALAGKFLRNSAVLVETKYFTSRIDGAHPSDPPHVATKKNASRLRQTVYLDALATLPSLKIIEGQFLTSPAICKACGHTYRSPKEKMTDVNIATELLMDAFYDRFDVAYVISGDSDLAPPIQAVRKAFPAKILRIAFPPKRHSEKLKLIATGWFSMGESALKSSQLPDPVVTSGGIALARPAKWR